MVPTVLNVLVLCSGRQILNVPIRFPVNKTIQGCQQTKQLNVMPRLNIGTGLPTGVVAYTFDSFKSFLIG